MAADPIEISTSVEFDLESFFAAAPPPAIDFGPDLTFRHQLAGGTITGCGNVQGEESCSGDPKGCFWLEGLEHFLLDEDDAGVVAVEDFLVDPWDGNSSSVDATSHDSGNGSYASPNGSSPESNDGVMRENEVSGHADHGNIGADGEEEEEEEDPEDKKRMRRLRNRDSAMKSRERRKLYVRDLEMKNRYLELECKRLEYLLHCCTAENLQLHQRLQKDRISGACGAKQESAVLFMKPLLLGSLFWLTTIGYLFLAAPNLLARRLEISETRPKARGVVPNLSRKNKGAKEVKSRELETRSTSDLVFMRRRCKALRTKIKILDVNLFRVST